MVGKVPVEGDAVVIPPKWNMYYDISTEAAVDLKSLDIRGRLTFWDPTVNGDPRVMELRSHMILLEIGELLIGTQDAHYQN